MRISDDSMLYVSVAKDSRQFLHYDPLNGMPRLTSSLPLLLSSPPG